MISLSYKNSMKSLLGKEMKINLIATDLDGTLLRNDKEPSRYTLSVLEEAHRQGIMIMPVTGRCWSVVPQWIKEAEFIPYIITSNGARIIDNRNKHTIFSEFLDKEMMLLTIQKLKQYKVVMNLYANAQIFVEDYTKNGDIRKIANTKRLSPDMYEYILTHDMELEKMDAYFEIHEERVSAWNEFKGVEGISLSAAFDFNVEINSVKGNKGEALIKMVNLLNFDLGSVVAFGDGVNDILLLKAAGIPVAVENAVEDIKKIALYETESNEDDGVARFIERNL
jgi:Cof subfamily protein (haloacid dehalogenase superfamily)